MGETKWFNKGHELDYIASILKRNDNKIYLVGTEKEIRGFYDRIGRYLGDNNRIQGIVLTDNQGGKSSLNFPSISDNDIPQDLHSIIICTSYDYSAYEVVRRLFENYGFKENVQFFQGEVFAMIYEVYELKEIRLDRVEIFLTSYCSLKCEKCIAYIPYFKIREHISLDRLKKDADILFSKINYIDKYKVLGGDALCYPYLEDYIKYVSCNYRDKIGTFRIGTNGTIFPKEELLEICRKHGVMFDISDYTKTIGNNSKLSEIYQLCLSNGIAVDIKRTGEQWLDLGFPNNLPREKDEEHLKNHFKKCAMFCRNFNDGKLFYCCSNFAATQAGLFPLDSNDYFDFNSEFTKEELLEYELGFSKLGHTTFCNVCRGCSDEINPYHVGVANQMCCKLSNMST